MGTYDAVCCCCCCFLLAWVRHSTRVRTGCTSLYYLFLLSNRVYSCLIKKKKKCQQRKNSSIFSSAVLLLGLCGIGFFRVFQLADIDFAAIHVILQLDGRELGWLCRPVYRVLSIFGFLLHVGSYGMKGTEEFSTTPQPRAMSAEEEWAALRCSGFLHWVLKQATGQIFPFSSGGNFLSSFCLTMVLTWEDINASAI